MTSPDHVTVAYDGSSYSELALHRALVVARDAPFGKVHVVCVTEHVAPHLVRLPSGVVMSSWSARESLRLIVSRAADECGGRELKRRVESHLRIGNPATVVVDLAYRFHSDQIIVGARGVDESYHEGVGSVARGILELSEIPVVIAMPGCWKPRRETFNAIRWAYVFGGRSLSQGTLGTASPKHVVPSAPS